MHSIVSGSAFTALMRFVHLVESVSWQTPCMLCWLFCSNWFDYKMYTVVLTRKQCTAILQRNSMCTNTVRQWNCNTILASKLECIAVVYCLVIVWSNLIQAFRNTYPAISLNLWTVRTRLELRQSSGFILNRDWMRILDTKVTFWC